MAQQVREQQVREQQVREQHEQSGEPTVASWLEQAGPPARSFAAAVRAASVVLLTGPEQPSPVVVGELRSSVQVLQQWSVEHPCPDPGLGDRLTVLAARVGFAALVLQDSGAVDGPMIEVLDSLAKEFDALVSGGEYARGDGALFV